MFTVIQYQNGKPVVKTVPVQITAAEGVSLPAYQTEGASGFDLQANNADPIVLPAGATRLVPTGIKVAVPHGFELQVRSRSGLALKNNVFVLNSPGTVDADYRGEVGVILHNASDKEFVVNRGDRIAQGVIAPVYHARFEVVEELDTTTRGAGGFGSTGV